MQALANHSEFLVLVSVPRMVMTHPTLLRPSASQLNYTLVVLHWLTAAFGPGIWRVEIFDLLPVGPPGWLPKSVQHATTNELVIAGVSAVASLTLVMGGTPCCWMRIQPQTHANPDLVFGVELRDTFVLKAVRRNFASLAGDWAA